MNEPLVSIVIPFYNNEGTLLDAIKSVFIQTYKNWELILLNDGSTDKSLEIASKIVDKRVKVISDGHNLGLVFRLNQSPSLVSGEYIARMDGDDLMHPQRIEKQMNLFMTNSDIDLVDTGAYSINELGNPSGYRGISPINNEASYILNNAMLLHASVIGKKEWFVKYPYNPIFVRAEDRELWLRSYKTSNFARVSEPLYIVREGKVNIKNYVQSVKTVREILRIYGPNIISKKQLIIEITKTYIKVLIIKLAGIFKFQDYITERRNNSLTTSQQKDLSDIIDRIKNIVVPT